ncbi:MAG: RICIN domain-containing protein [Clostridia bacterium]|nr:RICIN domain-containing protein [Clostridia bacterium]
MKFKRIIAIMVCAALLAGAVPAFAADDDVKIVIGGQEMAFSSEPCSVEGRTMVPAEEFFAALGAEYTYDEAAGEVIVVKDDVTLVMALDETVMERNGFEMGLDAGAQLIDGEVYVPLRAVAEALGQTVSWDARSGDIVITSYETENGEYETDPMHKAYFTIASQEGQLLTSDDGLKMEDDNGSDNQIWLLLSQGGGYYTLTNKGDGKSPDVPSYNTDEGVGIITYSVTGGDNQIFLFDENEDGTYTLIAKHSSLALTIGEDGGLTQEALTSSSYSQRFTLTFIETSDTMTMGVAVQAFMSRDDDKVNNIKVQWNEISGADRYDVFRSVDGGEYTYLASLTGVMYDDYGLNVGSSYRYKVRAISGGSLLDERESEECVPYDKPDVELSRCSNLVPEGITKPNTFYIDGVYYRFSARDRTDGGYGFGQLIMTTSTDDITYGNETEVLNVQDILSHETCLEFEDCKFESNNYLYNEETGMFYWWAHFEQSSGYGTARVAVAYGKPGERWTFGGAFRPDGDDSRDMNIFVDDDNKAYLIAAINVNADLALYKLTDDWTDVEKKLCIVNYSSYRELPSILKKDGIYYLFSSGTAGWYPTQGMYNVATNIEGPWSELRSLGNRTTFSAQSGSVSRLVEGGDNAVMNAYRWMWYWDGSDNRVYQNRMLPISVDNGYAFYDFYDELLYNVENDVLIPVQQGRLLSQSKPVTASGNPQDASYVNDGDYQTYWEDDFNWPDTITIDLEDEYDLSEIQISWYIRNGSEAYYHYIVEGSVDGENYELLLDRSEGYTEYGFTANDLYGSARYVRLTMIDAVVRGTDENTYSPRIYEIKVFGE